MENTNTRSSRKKQKSRKKRNRIIKWVVGITLFILASIAALIFGVLVLIGAGLQSVAVPTTLLVLGVDTGGSRDSNESTHHADAIQYVTINNTTNEMGMVSIPRETKVVLPCTAPWENGGGYTEGSYQRISHVYSACGLDGIIEVIETQLGLPVDYHLMLTFDTFLQTIQPLMPLQIVSNGTFCEQDHYGNPDVHCFENGITYDMNEEQALAYLRHRKSDGHAQREVRQQQIMIALIENANQMDLSELINIGTNFVFNIESNFDIKFLTRALFFAVNIDNIDVYKFTPGLVIGPGSAATSELNMNELSELHEIINNRWLKVEEGEEINE